MKTAIEVLEEAIRKRKDDLAFVYPLASQDAKIHKERIQKELSDLEHALEILDNRPHQLNLPPLKKRPFFDKGPRRA